MNGLKTYLTEDRFRVILKEISSHYYNGTPVDRDLLEFGSYKLVLKSVGRIPELSAILGKPLMSSQLEDCE
jgi:hypothetical protein